MPSFIGSDIRQDQLLEHLFGLNELDKRIYHLLTERDTELQLDDLAEEVDRDRSTVYRSVQRLLEEKLVEKKQFNYDTGGYCHVYRAVDPAEVADRMENKLNAMYVSLNFTIQDFRQDYGLQTGATGQVQ